MRGERRLVTRFAAIAFNRVEQRGLFTADIGAGAPTNLNVELQAAVKNAVAEKPVFIGRLDGLMHTFCSQRIFSTQVDVAPARARNEAANRDALKHREGI